MYPAVLGFERSTGGHATIIMVAYVVVFYEYKESYGCLHCLTVARGIKSLSAQKTKNKKKNKVLVPIHAEGK